MVNYWTHTGETDYYGLYEEVLSGLLEDESQAKIRELAGELISSPRSALVTTVPTPGLAEELHYLNLYTMLISELPTSEHSEAELMNSVNEYLVNFSTEAVYPDSPKAEAAHPMISFSWTSLTEDHEEGLKLLLELLSDTKVDDGAAINDILERNMDSFDLSRNANFMYLARDIAGSGFSKEYAYKRLFSDQDFYYFLKDVSSRLSEDEDYFGELISYRAGSAE